MTRRRPRCPTSTSTTAGLFGSPQRIAERLQPWLSCGITSLTVNTEQDEALELMADLVGTGDPGGRSARSTR